MSDAARKEATLKIRMPADLAGCHALIEQLACTVHSQTDTIEQLHREKQEIELAFAKLMQRAFRNRSERYINNPNQLRLDFKDTDDAADAAEGVAQAVEEAGHPVKAHVRRRRARKPRSEALPAHLPRYEVEASVPEHLKHCPKHGERTLIGYDSVETLEFERPKLRVRVTKYAKYACHGHADCGIASPERPTGLVEGDRYDTSVAAEIITGKYGFHLPIYRQQDLFAGGGWTPDRSTLLNILAASAFVIRPLAEHIKQVVLSSDILGTDDTRVTLLLPATIPKAEVDDPKSQRIYEVLSEAAAEGRRSVTARMWAYRSVTIPLNVFDFTVSRHRDGPDLMLADFCGTLMADCYAGYEGIALRSDGRIQRAACVAHARRKVFDAQEAYPLESSLVLAKFQQLYDIEERAKALSVEDRFQLRQGEAAEVWASLDDWLASEAAGCVLPKSKLGGALGYLRNHWRQLQTYLSDGRIPIDNNEVEQLMKQVAIGRKNSYDLLSRTQRRKNALLQSTWKYGPGRPAARDPVGRRSPCSSEASGRRPIGWAAGRACGRAPRSPSLPLPCEFRQCRLVEEGAKRSACNDGRSNSYSGIGYPMMRCVERAASIWLLWLEHRILDEDSLDRADVRSSLQRDVGEPRRRHPPRWFPAALRLPARSTT